MAWVIPIWKGSDKEQASDYRPISLTSHIGKVIERIFRKAMTDHLVANMLIEPSQHGSREGRGTLTQLLEQHDWIMSQLSEGNNVESVYLDFSKAFDYVDHSIVLEKLNKKRVSGLMIRWVRSFLRERKFRVRIDNSLSEASPLVSGVPQGSVLGPLLFLVFISDLGEGLEDSVSKVLKYVDDTKVFGVANTEDQVVSFQETLNDVFIWAEHNNMKWNALKFQLLRFGKNENLKEDSNYFTPQYSEVIARSEVVKDLGVRIDHKLNYKDQLQTAVEKSNKKINWILRTFTHRSIPFLRSLWLLLVQPHMDYASPLWCPVGIKEDIIKAENPLRNLTRRGAGMMQFSYWERLKQFKLFSNNRRMERYRAFYIWKSLNRLVPSLNLEWSDTVTTRGPQLMIPGLAGVQEGVKARMLRGMRFEGVKIFNSLPITLRTWTGTKDSFKKGLDLYLAMIPDCPITETLIPDCKDCHDRPSNSIVDWRRKLNISPDTVLDFST